MIQYPNSIFNFQGGAGTGERQGDKAGKQETQESRKRKRAEDGGQRTEDGG
jgi:hypothetical protein